MRAHTNSHNANQFLQITYLNSVVMPDVESSSSSDNEGDDESNNESAADDDDDV